MPQEYLPDANRHLRRMAIIPHRAMLHAMRRAQRWLSGVRISFRQWAARARQILSSEPGDALDEGVTERTRARATEARKLRGGVAKRDQLIGYWGSFSLAEEAREALASLWDSVDAIPWEAVKSLVEEELGAQPQAYFDSFSKEPIAAASLGQVHTASVAGKHYAVKIQYPGIDDALRSDAGAQAQVRKLAGPALSAALDGEAIDALRSAILSELDYRAEAASLRTFATAFERDQDVSIPEVDRDRTSSRVLTMTMCQGLPLARAHVLSEDARSGAAATILRFSWHGPLCHGLVHADPNPGNFLLSEQHRGRVAFLDFGCVARLSERERRREAALWSSLLHDDVFAVAENFRHALIEQGLVRDIQALSRQSYRRWEELVTAPYRSETPFFWNHHYAHRLLEATHKVCGTGLLCLRDHQAILWRARIGTVATLGLLEASVPARAILRSALESRR